MKFTVALAALVAAVAAQDISQLPKCAQTCASQGFPQSCGLDVKCICTSDQFLAAITCCIAGTCNSDEQKQTIKFAKGICGGVGVNVPDSAVCPTGSSSSSTPSPTSSGGSSSTSETGSVTGTAIPGSSTPAPSGTSTRASSSSGSSTRTSASSTQSSPPTQTGNAAVSLNANGGLLAAVAAAVVAFA